QSFASGLSNALASCARAGTDATPLTATAATAVAALIINLVRSFVFIFVTLQRLASLRRCWSLVHRRTRCFWVFYKHDGSAGATLECIVVSRTATAARHPWVSTWSRGRDLDEAGIDGGKLALVPRERRSVEVSEGVRHEGHPLGLADHSTDPR